MLSDNHVKLLKTLRRHNVVREKLNNPDLEYLHSIGLVTMSRYNDPRDPYVDASLTEKGKAALDEKLRELRNPWIDRLFGFIAGVASTVLAQFIIQAIQASIG